ncbi:GPI mannosyltransferase 1 [Ceratina calcarata]|uniref:GPI alpha-1,4-mannosyltransferase I, catalytic subunit n=1 Tax=Ceratina calcarata TaxID=156304 RepID=A0AAJ7J4A9_9HYME|nr:GPI mannosyltransferase 1 [Ceratina calcarata]
MIELSFKSHCVAAFLLRVTLVYYSNFHDKTFNVPYTDVDYKVFTDAARHMVKGSSPFDRDTYRYSPLLALLLTPNIFLNENCGKILFSLIDILVAVLIKKILTLQKCNEKLQRISLFTWLYNPVTIVISTRGNADSLAVLLVMQTLYLFLQDRFVLTGLMHALSIHFRLYPIVFSLPMYFTLRDSNYFVPNKSQLKLVFSCVSFVVFLTGINYYLYGYKYLYESLIYHIVRRDAKHNFSVYFYMLYLSANNPPMLQKIFTFLPQLILLLLLSYKYSSKSLLPFAMLTQAMVMVTYNPVLTSQYFFWYMSLIPLCLPRFELSIRRSLCLCFFWIFSQALWLLAAYLLEFQGLNTFTYIWSAGLFFFVVNVKILNDFLTYVK